MDSADGIPKSLALAWSCVLEQYTPKIIKDSRENGPGLALFIMRERNKSPFNCNYIYLKDKEPEFESFIKFSEDREFIKEKYDPVTMYLVCIQVPDPKDPGQTVGNIKAFLYKDNTEIKL